MGRYQRRKGADYERSIVVRLKELGIDARRRLQSQGEDIGGPDVELGSGQGIECKHHSRFPSTEIARIVKGDDGAKLAAIKITNVGEFVAMSLEQFAALYKRAEEGKPT